MALSKVFIENIKNVPSELGDHERVVQYTHTESDCRRSRTTRLAGNLALRLKELQMLHAYGFRNNICFMYSAHLFHLMALRTTIVTWSSALCPFLVPVVMGLRLGVLDTCGSWNHLAITSAWAFFFLPPSLIGQCDLRQSWKKFKSQKKNAHSRLQLHLCVSFFSNTSFLVFVLGQVLLG